MRLVILLLFGFFVLISSCAKEEPTIEIIENKEIDLQMIDAYEEGMLALEEQDGLTAAKKVVVEKNVIEVKDAEDLVVKLKDY